MRLLAGVTCDWSPTGLLTYGDSKSSRTCTLFHNYMYSLTKTELLVDCYYFCAGVTVSVVAAVIAPYSLSK